MPVELIEPMEDDIEEVVDQEPEKEEKQVEQPKDTLAMARQIGAEIYGQIKAESNAQGVQQPSKVQIAIKEMLDEGVPPLAIKRILKLREAERADEQEIMNAHQQKAAMDRFNDECWQIGAMELEKYSANIPVLANAGQGLRSDLLAQLNEVISTDPEFASVRHQIRSGRHPDARKVAQGAAKVVDAWLAGNGLSKPKPSLNLQSSKVQPAEAKANFDDFSKGQKQLYHTVLKHTGDEKKAMKRALELAS